MKEKMNFNEIIRKYNLAILLVVFILISAILSPNFLTLGNFLNLLQQASIPGIVAIGMTLVILLGGIDLSVGSVLAFSGMIASIIVEKMNGSGASILLGCLAGIAVGTAMGLLTGVLIARFNLPDFIASLAMMEIGRGAALLTTSGNPVFGLGDAFHILGGGFLFGRVAISGLFWIILTAIFAFMLKYSIFGRSLFAIGGNREAAMLSGIKTKRNYALTYMISGLLSGFAGVLTASWMSTGQPTAGNGYELDAIAASVIGGASLSGGIGSIGGTFGGVFLLQIITNIFNLVGLPSYYQRIAKGAIIIFALLLNQFVSKGKGGKE
ncbi:ABC transporter permease [Muricomes intestini]|jgi:ribose transport system permease protein|uniref:Ribose transport system permease protein n=3 Tax=Muricomes intestini TaxID=1796634 RepID=A0A4R3K3X8_9FIRM|nr:ABC transporter permease [Muricomes intestini]TCS77449.1 ribose transport system permease protein [Muricomes intestini]HAX53491.1 ABC transporter permease [Lachnospiraceae bacterium]HCR84123.1 ABC transporter permease [Lachnospiraceae bacterium]